MIINNSRLNINKDMLPIYFLFGSLLTFSTRGFQEAQENLFNIGNLIRYISMPTFYLYTFHLCYKRKFNSIPKFLNSIVFLFLFWIIGLISLTNSQWFSYSIIKWIEYFQLFFVAFYIIKMENNKPGFSKKVFQIVIKFFEILMVTVLVGLILSPSNALYFGNSEYSALRSAAIPFRLSGYLIPITSTSVGFLSSFLFYNYLVEFANGYKKKLLKTKIVISFIFIIIAQARMAILGVAIAIAVYFLFINKKIIYKILIIYALILGSVFFSNTFLNIILRGQDLTQIFTLSGRLEWWNYALEVFNELNIYEKLFGMGFAGGEKVVAAQSNAAMYTLDSELLGTLISTGILGSVFLMLSVICIFLKLIKLKKYNIERITQKQNKIYIYQVTGIMIILVVRMITTNTFSTLSYYSILYVISIILIQKIIWEIKNEFNNRKNINTNV